jgi:hypothetical protein
MAALPILLALLLHCFLFPHRALAEDVPIAPDRHLAPDTNTCKLSKPAAAPFPSAAALPTSRRYLFDRDICTGLGDRLGVLLSLAALARMDGATVVFLWCEDPSGIFPRMRTVRSIWSIKVSLSGHSTPLTRGYQWDCSPGLSPNQG